MILRSIQEHSDYLHSQVLMSMSERWNLHRKRVEFGRQKLELWMFVPCKLVYGVWVVLEKPEFPKPENRRAHDGLAELYDFQLKEYQEAKDRVLFEGFTYHIGLYKNNPDFWFVRNSSHKIHDYQIEVAKLPLETLVNLNYLMELTPTAQKQIGL